VGHEVLGIIEDQIILHLFRLRIVAAPQIELPEFFVIRGGNAHDVAMLEELRKNSSRKMEGDTSRGRRPLDSALPLGIDHLQ
jgi:hypothetical protein